MLSDELRPEGNEPDASSSGSGSWRRWCAGAVTWWWIFRGAAGAALTRAEEDASGRSRAYLVDYGPDEVINWSYDETGGLEWVVIRTSCLQQIEGDGREVGAGDAVGLLRPRELPDLPESGRRRSRIEAG